VIHAIFHFVLPNILKKSISLNTSIHASKTRSTTDNTVLLCCCALFFLITFCSHAVSQPQLDSLLQQYRLAEKIHSPLAESPKLLNDIARTLYMRSPDSAQRFAAQALTYATKTKDIVQQGYSHTVFGLIYLDNALYDKALEELLLALRLYERANDSLWCAKVYSNIGNVYGRQNQYDLALSSYKKAMEYYERVRNVKDFLSANTNIGFTYWKQGKYDLALEYHYRSLERAIEQKIPFSYTIAHINLGATYVSKKLYDSAEVHLEQARKLSMEQSNKRMLSITLYYLALAKFGRNVNTEARRLTQESLSLAEELRSREEILKCLKLLADIDFAEGRFREAILAERRYAALKDSLFNLDNTKTLASLQALYTTEKKDNEIKLLRRDAEVQTLERKSEAVLRNTLIFGLLAIALVAAVLANRYSLKKRSEERLQAKNQEITRQQEILEDQATEIELSNSQLHETNIKLLDANDELQSTYQEILRQQHILEQQAADIQENNTRLQESNIELQRLNTEKNEFLGIVAHDLKNPLGSIIVSVNNLQKYHSTLSSEQQFKLFERILEVGSRMKLIIEDILDVNAIESGQMNVHCDNINVSLIVTDVVEQYRAQAEKKFLSLRTEFDENMRAFADAGKVHEIMDNLVSNALKYSPPGKNVVVRIREGHSSLGIGREDSQPSLAIGHWSGDKSAHGTTTDEVHTPNDQWLMTNDQAPSNQALSNHLRIEVADEGPGISEDDMKRLFGKFTRLSARPTGGEHSTGLGLSIVKKMVEAMNGRVWCESELGKGATFIVELPTVF
jgi:signal transduction histidine kinase/tetratricopeptide (TPR) repeat protein